MDKLRADPRGWFRAGVSVGFVALLVGLAGCNPRPTLDADKLIREGKITAPPEVAERVISEFNRMLAQRPPQPQNRVSVSFWGKPNYDPWEGFSFHFSLPGDGNDDFRVDFSDVVVLVNNYGKVVEAEEEDKRANPLMDENGDGVVDSLEMVSLVENFDAELTGFEVRAGPANPPTEVVSTISWQQGIPPEVRVVMWDRFEATVPLPWEARYVQVVPLGRGGEPDLDNASPVYDLNSAQVFHRFPPGYQIGENEVSLVVNDLETGIAQPYDPETHSFTVESGRAYAFTVVSGPVAPDFSGNTDYPHEHPHAVANSAATIFWPHGMLDLVTEDLPYTEANEQASFIDVGFRGELPGGFFDTDNGVYDLANEPTLGGLNMFAQNIGLLPKEREINFGRDTWRSLDGGQTVEELSNVDYLSFATLISRPQEDIALTRPGALLNVVLEVRAAAGEEFGVGFIDAIYMVGMRMRRGDYDQPESFITWIANRFEERRIPNLKDINLIVVPSGGAAGENLN